MSRYCKHGLLSDSCDAPECNVRPDHKAEAKKRLERALVEIEGDDPDATLGTLHEALTHVSRWGNCHRRKAYFQRAKSREKRNP